MVVLQLGKKPFLDREAMKGAEESAIWDWLTAFVVMLDKTLMATSFLSVSLFQWPLFPDSNCDRRRSYMAGRRGRGHSCREWPDIWKWETFYGFLPAQQHLFLAMALCIPVAFSLALVLLSLRQSTTKRKF